MSTNILLNDNARYGISALDLSHKDDAINDELMVQGTTGKMFYKRENDGQIVTDDIGIYDRNKFMRITKKAIGSGLTILPDDYAIYNTINISCKTNMMESSIFDLGLTRWFNVSPTESGFLISVTGNDMTNSAISFMKKYYENKNTTTNDTPDVSITYDVIENGISDTVRTEVASFNFNELVFVRILPDGDTPESFSVRLSSISFPAMNTIYSLCSNQHKEELKKLNYGNGKFEASTINMITFTKKLDNAIIFDEKEQIAFKEISSVSDILNYIGY